MTRTNRFIFLFIGAVFSSGFYLLVQGSQSFGLAFIIASVMLGILFLWWTE